MHNNMHEGRNHYDAIKWKYIRVTDPLRGESIGHP